MQENTSRTKTAPAKAPASAKTASVAPREEMLVSAASFQRRAGETIWSQISRSIEDQIVNGNLPSGTRLPTETQLAASYEVNRHTLRRAVRELVRKGLITATPRRGTIVSRQRLKYPIERTTTFEQIISATGREPADRLMGHSTGQAPKETAEWLGIAERSSVVEIRFLRVANDVPICLTNAWLPEDRFARVGQMFERLGGLERALAQVGVTSRQLKQTRITSQSATTEECQHLEMTKGASVLIVNSMFVDDCDEPILVCNNRFAADRIELVVETV